MIVHEIVTKIGGIIKEIIGFYPFWLKAFLFILNVTIKEVFYDKSKKSLSMVLFLIISKIKPKEELKMKKIYTKIIIVIVLLLSVITFNACSTRKELVGIIQFGEHDSLNDCYEGIIKGLKEELKDDFDKYAIELQNSNFEASTSAAQANTFVSKNARVLVAIATPTAMAAAAASKGAIPVVYCAVSDPNSAGLTTLSNVTGSSDKLDFDSQLALIKRFIPNVSRIGVMYTLGEANSISQIEILTTKAQSLGIEIIRQPITNAIEIPTATDTLISKGIDCITNLTDNTVVGALDIILAKTNEAKIPVFGSEIDQVKKGCLASASLDYVALGEATGKIIAKILKGELQASNDNAISVEDSFNCYSKKVVELLGITLPDVTDIQNVD